MNKIDDDFNEQCANQYVQDHESENRFQGKISNADTEYNNMYEDQTQNHSRDKRIQRVKQEDKEFDKQRIYNDQDRFSDRPHHSDLKKYQYDRKNNFTDENDYYPDNDKYDYHNEPCQSNNDLQEEEDIDCSENKYTNSLDDLGINQYNRNVSDEYEYD